MAEIKTWQERTKADGWRGLQTIYMQDEIDELRAERARLAAGVELEAVAYVNGTEIMRQILWHKNVASFDIPNGEDLCILQSAQAAVAAMALERDEYRTKYNDTFAALDDCARSNHAQKAALSQALEALTKTYSMRMYASASDLLREKNAVVAAAIATIEGMK